MSKQLLLVWVVAIVNTGGYFLFIQSVPEGMDKTSVDCSLC